MQCLNKPTNRSCYHQKVNSTRFGYSRHGQLSATLAVAYLKSFANYLLVEDSTIENQLFCHTIPPDYYCPGIARFV
jgi:hypothetical protein